MPSPNERLSAANVIDNVVFNGVKVDNSTSAKLAHRILRDLASAGYEVMPVPSREDLLTAEDQADLELAKGETYNIATGEEAEEHLLLYQQSAAVAHAAIMRICLRRLASQEGTPDG